MKTLKLFLLVLLLVVTVVAAQAANVLYDDTHAQTAGNADWVPEGAYSDMVDMLKTNGYNVKSLSNVDREGVITSEILADFEALILAEPNNPYSDSEQKAIVDFVRNGGGLFIIGDHGNADRNGNGWDAVRVFNTFCPKFGFKFKGNDVYEAPLTGPSNSNHPVMFGVKAMGVWAGSTFDIIEGAEGKAVGLLDSRFAKSPYMVAAEFGKGRVVAIGDSSPFDDGTGSGGKNKLHDSYDSFMYSHPQFAYNAMVWVNGKNPTKRIPSRPVNLHNAAKASERHLNILVDAAHGNAASDKMKTFEKHMNKMGLKVYYTLNLIKPEMLKNFGTLVIPDPSLRFIDSEAAAIADWFMAGGNLVMGSSWDSSKLRGASTLNFVLSKLGAVMRFNDDQVWDQTNKTNKPWGVVATDIKAGHPVTKGVNKAIVWGTCSLIDRNKQPLTENAGIEILVAASNVAFNKFRNPEKPGVLYPKGTKIPIMATEKIVNGTLVLIGCCNFTDYQYPDSDINQALGGQSPVKHETPQLWNNLMNYLSSLSQKSRK